MLLRIKFLTFCFLLALQTVSQDLYNVTTGIIEFKSNAPQENIAAKSESLTGIIDLTTNKFAFAVDIKSFQGFNSPLQREHFYENYMEYQLYPKATYSGKLIDKFNPLAEIQKIRSKGILTIHGVNSERIIEVTIRKKGDRFALETEFNVLLTDHNIRIPKVVFQKIAENINVIARGEMLKK